MKKDKNGKSSLSSKLSKLSFHKFEKYFKENCKEDNRPAEKAYGDIGGILPKKDKNAKT